ncbi:MAG: anthranilate phosphoribosyltransferase [Planctomycetota bacterium]|nr:MAG: anthranilate phosphoribosyltransferase [Planctomycetota bacterium]
MHAEIVRRIRAGTSLTIDEADELIYQIMDGRWPAEAIAELLTALHEKGESTGEIAGAARAMRRHMTTIPHRRPQAIDIVGTGGDGSGTFNISTAAALVTAAAGVPVAKHGNRRITSKSGSADVLAELGVNVEADVATVADCLNTLGVCFCFAPLLHAAMRHVAPVRKALPHPTIFNILGPLANPAGAKRQLLGVGRPQLRPIMAETLGLLGTEKAAVVHGAGGLDEVSLAGETRVTWVVADASGAAQLTDEVWTPADFGLPQVEIEALRVPDSAASAAVIRDILAGKPGPARDVVLANAGAAIYLADKADSLPNAVEAAAQAIDSGAAAELLTRLVERSRRPASEQGG